MMELYLMRHAEALLTGGTVRSDDERPLSARGEAQAQHIAEQLLSKGVALGGIIASPLRRTQQTAAILSEALGIRPVQSSRFLAPSGGIPRLQAILPKKSPAGGLLLIGHQPDMGMLAASLVEIDCGFSPATLAAFHRASDRKPWELRFILTPAFR
jgi:phosphohistidine phosphatase